MNLYKVLEDKKLKEERIKEYRREQAYIDYQEIIKNHLPKILTEVITQHNLSDLNNRRKINIEFDKYGRLAIKVDGSLEEYGLAIYNDVKDLKCELINLLANFIKRYDLSYNNEDIVKTTDSDYAISFTSNFNIEHLIDSYYMELQRLNYYVDDNKKSYSDDSKKNIYYHY